MQTDRLCCYGCTWYRPGPVRVLCETSSRHTSTIWRNAMLSSSFVFVILLALFAIAASAQTTSFVYQGKLQDAGLPANGVYQFQFKPYDAETGGAQVGPTVA